MCCSQNLNPFFGSLRLSIFISLWLSRLVSAGIMAFTAAAQQSHAASLADSVPPHRLAGLGYFPWCRFTCKVHEGMEVTSLSL